MNIFEDRINEFLELLCKNDVRFILVGGLAVNYYGYSRATGDVDLWMEDSPENRQKFVAALKILKIEGAEAFLTYPLVAGFAEIILNNGVYVDIMSDLQIFKKEDFNECYLLAENFVLNEQATIKVLHIRKLIEEKSRSLRPKDKEDAEQLKKLMK